MRKGLLVVVVALAALPILVAAPPTDAAARGPETALTGVAQVVTGGNFSCARLTSGQARCWGHNLQGELGDGTGMNSPSPVVVSNAAGTGPLTGITQLTAGSSHACARLSVGQVRCWGLNVFGQLGDSSTTIRLRPVAVRNLLDTGPLTGVGQVSSGLFHTCALRSTDGGAWCWGQNRYGQLGDGRTADRHRPQTVRNFDDTHPLTGLTSIETGSYHTCGVLAESGGVAGCWGQNGYGQLGSLGTANRSLPFLVLQDGLFFNGVDGITLGRYHTCLRLASGHGRCFGNNIVGQLGDGTFTTRTEPVNISRPAGPGQLAGIARLDAGINHTCALLTSGQARCWGGNGAGQLGDGTPTNRTRPVTVRNETGIGVLVGITGLDGGLAHTCARLSTAQVRCWGGNAHGQLGTGGTSPSSLPVVVQA